MQQHITVGDLYNFKVNAEDLATLYLRHIHQRVHLHHFNYLGIITGKHRTGKSLGALSFAHAVDPTFIDNIEDRVVYYANDFLRALQKVRQQKIIGGCVVFDEAGIGYSSRDWYEETNKAVGGAMQVVGRYQPIVFFVSQDIKLIDSQIRKYFHGFYEMYRSTTRYALVLPYNVSYNKRSGKIYYIYTRLSHPNEDAQGQTIRLNSIKLKRPPKEVEKRYEVHSKAFKDHIMEMMEQQTKVHDPAIKQKKVSDQEILDELVNMDDLSDLEAKRSTKSDVILDKDMIRFKFNVSDAKARFLKRRAEMIINKPKQPEEKQNDK
jgi:hypothetical protein